MILDYDVVVLGAGPVGLFSVFACGMVGLRVGMVDALPEVGGQCSALYASKPIYDIPGHPSILAGTLIDCLKRQIEPFKPEIFLDAPVCDIKNENGIWHVHRHDVILTGRAILICTGAGAFAPKRPSIPNIEYFEHTSVVYRVDNPKHFAGKRVVIVGGGDSAVDWSLLLCEHDAKVSLVHRRDVFRAQESSLALLKSHLDSGKIKLFAPCQVTSLDGSNCQLARIELQHATQGNSWIECDILLPCFGLETQKSPFESWGLSVKAGLVVTTPTTGESSVFGIYAAGDCVSYPEKLKLIMTGFSEVTQAAHHIRKTHFSERVYRFEHSTSLGVPK